VDVSDKVYDGTRAATVDTSSATFVGLVSGDDVEVTAGSFTFDSKDVGVNIPVHASNVQIGGADGGNYNLVAQTPFSADITPAPLIAAITGNPTKTYDGNDRPSSRPRNTRSPASWRASARSSPRSPTRPMPPRTPDRERSPPP
jgi:hypothetical protein